MRYIEKFIDDIKLLDAKHSKEMIMSLSDAKKLHTDITKVLLKLTEHNNTTNTTNTTENVIITLKDW